MNSTGWLMAGMLCGLVIALGSLSLPPQQALPDDVIARVNGRDVPLRDWRRAVDGANAARREPLDSAEQRAILDRLIDEQLLLSHALDLGLPYQSPGLRKQTVATLLELLRADSQASPVDEATLRAFFAENISFFEPERQLRLRVYRAATSDRLEHFDPSRDEQLDGIQRDHSVPSARLPASRLELILGSTLGAQLKALHGTGARIITQTGNEFALLILDEDTGTIAPEFAGARDQVEREWRRRQSEQNFTELLRRLRQDYPVSVHDELL